MDNLRSFSSAEALRFGWDTTRAHLKSLLPIGVAAAFLALLQQSLGGPGFLRFFLSGLLQILQAAVTMVWIRAALRLHDGKPIGWSDLTDGLEGFFTFLLTWLLYGLIVAGGLILLVVPGVFWAVTYGFSTWAAVDRTLDPVSSLRESSRITRGHRWQLFGFGLYLIGINLLGAMALGIGLLVTVPTSFIAAARVYRRLEAVAPAHIDLTRPAPIF
jgi:uncharacterized membrane protein